MLWIWQKKSNRLADLKSHVWDEWADEEGTIGKAYGYQMAKKYKFKQGEMDQVDNVLWCLKNDRYSRRILTNLYNFEDLSEMRLEPCAYSMTFNVKGEAPVRTSVIGNYRAAVVGCVVSFEKAVCDSRDVIREDRAALFSLVIGKLAVIYSELAVAVYRAANL